MYYSAIKNCDIANGEGVRVSLFVSGCRIHCKNCFNQGTWNFKNGKEFTKEVEDGIIKMLEPYYITGLTILGGEPFEEENQTALLPFIKRVKETYPEKSIWMYSGYYINRLLNGDKYIKGVTNEILDAIDVLVDGPFEEENKDISLQYRGSSNQTLWDMKTNKKYVIHCPDMTSKNV